jgi:hypothetical protein
MQQVRFVPSLARFFVFSHLVCQQVFGAMSDLSMPRDALPYKAVLWLYLIVAISSCS